MKKYLTVGLFFCAILFAFRPQHNTPLPKETLSEYGFFEGKLADQKPAEGVVPYQLNTPLFSDYAEKLRFVKLPQGQSVTYNPDKVLEFPVGTAIIKTFYYPHDFRRPEVGRQLIETRLLLHEPDGWKALEYVWNDDQTEAYLEVAGDTKNVSWIHTDGKKRNLAYTIPNLNQCKGCHNRDEKMTPIGPSARQLNGAMTFGEHTENQLIYWKNKGILTGLPALEEVPKAAVWNDPNTGTVAQRARTWLDINCAHCHNDHGPAKTSGLDLSYHETNPTRIGIHKPPVAAGRGAGGRLYSIVPGQPDKSILVYRLDSTDPGEMMPELGRKTTHTEGVALVREWIKQLK
ncbi:MAG: SO2930 family diheme c-type cytochrome [Runella sp.]